MDGVGVNSSVREILACPWIGASEILFDPQTEIFPNFIRYREIK